MKLLLMIYPIKHYIDDDYVFGSNGEIIEVFRNSLCLNTWEEMWTKSLKLKEGEFRNRFKLINKLIDEYRKNDYNVGWVFFGKAEKLELPNEEIVSNIFDIKNKDFIISSGVSYHELNSYKYPDEKIIISKFKKLDELVVGGFHKEDCVSRFSKAAKELSILSKVDELLTEHFFFLILRSFDYDLDALNIKRGFLDPEMHEDNPEEMKRLTLGERISKYL